MKPIAHRDGGGGAHPLGEVEHVLAAVAVRHKCVLDGVQQTSFTAAMGEPVVTWILREDGRILEVTEKSERLAGKADSISFFVAFGTLPERGVPVLCLIEPGIEARSEKRQRIERIVEEQREFVLRIKRA